MISIIIPVFNRGKEIGKCLASILVQTYKNYEVIIIDDGSTDNSEEIISQYKEEFGIALTVHTQKNQGPQIARNNGAKFSRGEFLLFCDADIIMQPTMLEKMLEALRQKPEAVYAYSNFIWVKKKFKLQEFSTEKLRTMPYIHTCSLLKKEYFPGFDVNIKRLQDWDLWLTILEQGHGGVWIDEFLFRKQSGATMSSWLPSIFYKIFPFLPSVKKYKQAVKIIKDKHKI